MHHLKLINFNVLYIKYNDILHTRISSFSTDLIVPSHNKKVQQQKFKNKLKCQGYD